MRVGSITLTPQLDCSHNTLTPKYAATSDNSINDANLVRCAVVVVAASSMRKVSVSFSLSSDSLSFATSDADTISACSYKQNVYKPSA